MCSSTLKSKYKIIKHIIMILLPSHRHRNGGNLVKEQEGGIPMYCKSSSLMIFTPWEYNEVISRQTHYNNA